MRDTWVSRLRLGFAIFLAAGVALVSYRYLVPDGPGLAPLIIANRYTHLGALTVHAGFAATALLLGGFQFLRPIRSRWPRIHRWMGAIYVSASLIGAVAGLILSLGTTAGPIAGWGFGLLAVTWFASTANAYRLARQRDFAQHERWMVRSFALALAAVTLRIYMPAAAMLRLDDMQAYRAIAWLAWVPNLIAAELLLWTRSPRTSPRLAASAQSPG